MKKYIMLFTLVSPMVAFAHSSSQEKHSHTDFTSKFPPLSKSYLKQFPKIEVQKAINLSAINTNKDMTKDTVRLLVGNPHFKEFASSRWNYAFNIRKPATQEYILCQAQIHFKRKVAHSVKWSKPICSYLLQEGLLAERPKPVKKVQVKSVPESYILSSALLFDFDSSNLNNQGLLEIEKVVNAIRGKYSQVDNIKIIGHTDKIGSSEYNMELSKRRAVSVSNYLSKLGLIASTIVGVGENQPVSSGCDYLHKNQRKKCLFKDRRVELVVYGVIE